MANHGYGEFIGAVRFEFPNRAAADRAARAILDAGLVRPDTPPTFGDVLADMWNAYIEDSIDNDPDAIHEYSSNVRGIYQPDMEAFAMLATPHVNYLHGWFTDENGQSWEWVYDRSSGVRHVNQMVRVTSDEHDRLSEADMALRVINGAIRAGASTEGIARLAKILFIGHADVDALALLASDPDADVARAASTRIIKAAT